MPNKSIIFKRIVFEIGFLLIFGFIMSCAGSPEIKTVAVNQSGEPGKNSNISPPLNNSNLEKVSKTPFDEEGKSSVISGRVEYLIKSPDKVEVAVSPFAQLFFLSRSDADFDQNLKLLNKAVKTKSPVRCTVREFSGRILKVDEQP